MLLSEALFALTHKASFDAISRRNASRRWSLLVAWGVSAKECDDDSAW